MPPMNVFTSMLQFRREEKAACVQVGIKSCDLKAML